MENIEAAKRICLERDAWHCRVCGSVSNLIVRQLVKRGGSMAWSLSNLATLCEKCSEEADNSIKNKNNKLVGVLLCGGKGTRLAPLTIQHNKHLLPIGNTFMCHYPIKTLRALGAYRILVVIDRENSDGIISVLGSGKELGLDISYKCQEGSFGIADALYLAKDFVHADENIIVILGDNIFDYNQIDKNINLENNKACIYTKKVSNPQDYGVAVAGEDGRITEIVEKPKAFVSDLAVLGLYIYAPEVFTIIEQIRPSDRGELEISAVNDVFAKDGTLVAKQIDSFWADCGSSIKKYCEASLYGAKIGGVSEAEIDNFRSTIFDNK